MVDLHKDRPILIFECLVLVGIELALSTEDIEVLDVEGERLLKRRDVVVGDLILFADLLHDGAITNDIRDRSGKEKRRENGRMKEEGRTRYRDSSTARRKGRGGARSDSSSDRKGRP